jgi:hypothetical protein
MAEPCGVYHTLERCGTSSFSRCVVWVFLDMMCRGGRKDSVPSSRQGASSGPNYLSGEVPIAGVDEHRWDGCDITSSARLHFLHAQVMIMIMVFRSVLWIYCR